MMTKRLLFKDYVNNNDVKYDDPECILHLLIKYNLELY